MERFTFLLALLDCSVKGGGGSHKSGGVLTVNLLLMPACLHAFTVVLAPGPDITPLMSLQREQSCVERVDVQTRGPKVNTGRIEPQRDEIRLAH